jgi:teichuronic acid biosynthesis protein TuaE
VTRVAELAWSKFQNSKFLRIAVICSSVIAFGLAIGWAVAQGSLILLTFIGAVALFLLLLFSQIRVIKLFTVQRFLLYLTIISGFIGSAILLIPIGPIHLFPYRMLLLLLWILFATGILLHGKVDISHIKVRRYLQFLGVWLLYAILTLAWAASKTEAIRDIAFLFMSVSSIFFVVYYFSNGKDLKRFYYLWLAVFAGLLLIGIWEHLTGQHLPVSGYFGETRVRFMFRPSGVFHNINDFATFLALSIPFALGFFRYAKRLLTRLVGLGAVVVAFYLIVVTGSRANMLAVLLELAFVVLLLTNIRQKVKVTVVAGIFLATVVVFLPGPIREFSSEITGGLSTIAAQAELDTGSVGVRMNLARNGLIFLSSTAGFGVGAGSAEYWMANFSRYDTSGILNPHNWWLEILVDYGIFIFAGYILLYLGLIRRLYEIYRRLDDRTDKMIDETLLVALVGFFFASISSSSIMAQKPQWFLFAFALAFLNYHRIKEAGEAR